MVFLVLRKHHCAKHVLDLEHLTRDLQTSPTEEGTKNDEIIGYDYLGNMEFLTVLCFLSNFIFTILWYAYRYDIEGTSNPSWTSVFG